ncbi:MAG: AAA family ATPase [Pseudomonadota bacterium]
MTHVHIIHAPGDLDALLAVHEALRREGMPDDYETRPGQGPKIEDAFAVIVLLSQDSVRSAEVKRDVEQARGLGLPLIAYRIDKARLGSFFRPVFSESDLIHADEPDALGRLLDAVKDRYKRRCPVVAVMNLKGGVGKTTIASQVFGAYQAERANRVLLIDLDPQYNLTQTFLDIDVADDSALADRSVISLFEKSRLHSAGAPSPGEHWDRLSTEPFNPPRREALVHALLGDDGPDGRLDLVSGQFEISKYAFASDPAALHEIKANFLRILDHYRSAYDLIVIDTNPNATFLTRATLAAADRVVAPMHADAYSLRGVKLLNQVITNQVSDGDRPALSVLFNAVGRNEQSTFEADTRNGVYDGQAGFALSKAVMEHAVPRSGHLVVKSIDPDAPRPPYQQLVAHTGRGGGLKRIREALAAVALEVERLSQA